MKEYDARKGLLKMAKSILNEAGADDEQLEVIGWDGEYIKFHEYELSMNWNLQQCVP